MTSCAARACAVRSWYMPDCGGHVTPAHARPGDVHLALPRVEVVAYGISEVASFFPDDLSTDDVAVEQRTCMLGGPVSDTAARNRRVLLREVCSLVEERAGDVGVVSGDACARGKALWSVARGHRCSRAIVNASMVRSGMPVTSTHDANTALSATTLAMLPVLQTRSRPLRRLARPALLKCVRVSATAAVGTKPAPMLCDVAAFETPYERRT